MKAEEHAAKAERISRAMRKLSVSDHELFIEAAMLAGAQWLNVALHRHGLTDSDNDVMHAEYLSGAMRIKVGLVSPDLVPALEEIEQLRPLYVRGDAPGGEVAAQRCQALLEVLRKRAEIARRFL